MPTIPENLVKTCFAVSEISLLQAIVEKEEEDDERSNRSITY